MPRLKEVNNYQKGRLFLQPQPLSYHQRGAIVMHSQQARACGIRTWGHHSGAGLNRTSHHGHHPHLGLTTLMQTEMTSLGWMMFLGFLGFMTLL